MTYEVTIPTFNSEMALWKQVVHGVNWLLRGKGAGTTPDAHALGFLRSGPDLDVPDIQVHVTPAGYLVEGEGDLVLKENSFTTVVSVCRPRSRGRIRLKSADPAAPPSIQHRLFGDPDDLDQLARGISAVRAIVREAPLSALVKRPLAPNWREDIPLAEIAGHLVSHAGTIYHPSGTCRMGPEDRSVVDPARRARGVRGLSERGRARCRASMDLN